MADRRRRRADAPARAARRQSQRPHPPRRCRTLRALKVVRGWLRASDFGLDHLRDVYVGPPGKGHLLHYVVGLEGALGADDARGVRVEPRSSYSDINPTAGENPINLLLTLGLVRREHHGDRRFPFVGDSTPT